MELSQAQEIASKYLALLRPYCKQIAIAGSIRREQPYVNDIEIVAIQDTKQFWELNQAVSNWKKVKGDCKGKYTQRILPEGVKLDLFFATEVNWGLILLIRTGNAAYSKWMMGTVVRQNGYQVSGGMLWKNGATVPVPDEETFYRLMNMRYLEPTGREM